ncbi:hypothetical protein EXU57_06900 [Segetibacter sp. 3557_3]|uniref:exosortase/archaeosortase family protein n=1 Tax=Segetibacter sp. 3557_3 TaxID=2547429 RepID=UPI0010585B87|nr:exosortase/archaeosortase family protein [Segetibacter sp. 3557_3]TDH27311.1 hypothetical protein EXU57_06900 [Segetibacter sp. 3557_3]
MIAIFFERTFGKASASVLQFLKRAALFLACWMILYHLILIPNHLANEWLTTVTGKATTQLLNELYSGGFSWVKSGSNAIQVFLSNVKVLSIADPCNALELYVLYSGFIFCLATSLARQFAFSIMGIAAIFFLNVLRCCAITWLNLNHPELSDFAHHYAFTFLMYGFIFAGWVIYMKKYDAKKLV